MPLSSLAPLAGLGSAFGEVSALADRQRQMQIRETLAAIQQSQARQQQQQFQQQQQALSGIGNLFGSGQLNNLMGGQGPQSAGPGGGGFAPQGGMNPGMFGPGSLTPPPPPGQQMAGLPQLTDAIYDLETSRGKNLSTSPAGALGPMQVMPDTARQYGATPQDAADPVRGKQLGDMIVGDLYKKYGGNPDLTAIAYNAGPGRADKIQAGAPISSLPGETQAYLTKLHRDLDLNMSPEQRQQTQASAQNAARQIPNILQTAGSWNMDGLAKLIEKTNPDASPEIKGAIFLKMAPLLSEQAKTQAANIFKTYEAGEHQYEFDTSKRLQEREFGIREADTQATRAQTAEFQRQRLAQGEQKVSPQTQAFDAFKAANPNATPEEQQQFIQTGRPARSGQSAAVQKFMTEHPNATADDIAAFTAQTAAQVSATRAFDSGPQGNITRSLNVAVDHLAVLEDAGKGLENTPVQYVNKIANAWAKETGQPPPTDFEAVKSIVKDELVKAVLGGVGALGDRQEVEGTISAASSPAQLQGVIKRYLQLMGGQARGLQQQFVTSKAGTEKDYQEKLFPRTRAALSEAGSPGAAGGQYPTATSVWEAYQAGKLPQDQALKILKDQFGVGGDAGTQP